jgi:ABC-type proline/glycine betaine transport system permease subunit
VNLTAWQMVVTPVALLTVCSFLCILIGFDLWISQKRWQTGARDLNPVVQHFVKNHGPTVGLLALGAINCLVMAAALMYLPLMFVLLGGKLALASIQLRSLLENEYSNAKQPQLRK